MKVVVVFGCLFAAETGLPVAVDAAKAPFNPASFSVWNDLRSVVDLKTRKPVDLAPWDRPLDPNPLPSLDSLAERVTDTEIDDTLDQITGRNPAVIIRRFKPDAHWLWRQWKGTVLYHSLEKAAFNMCAASLSCLFLRKFSGGQWKWGIAPASVDPNNPVIARLKVLEKVWTMMMSLTTFLLTFFVGQSYNLWREFYNIGRRIQGRMNDFHLVVATHAARMPTRRKFTTNVNGDDSSTTTALFTTYTPRALQLLNDVGRNMRAYHVLMWAGCARRFRVLLTDRGLERMVVRGILTRREKETLDQLSPQLPRTQLYNSLLEWAMIRCNEALLLPQGRKALLVGDPTALQTTLLEKACALRGVVGSIGDQLDGRMPLAYTHFVQILVDSFLILAPVAQYAQLGAFSILSVGILTIFYSGLLDLAKVFLDPLDNEDYCQGSVYMDISVFITEANAGSNRFKDGAELCVAS